MGRKKRKRFAQLKFLPNVIDRTQLTGNFSWLGQLFGREAPLILELGCGRGEYTLALARRYPEYDVLGVDRNGARLWKGATKAVEIRLRNAAFVRTRVEMLAEVVPTGRVVEIWIPFPDPLPRRRQAKHRLVGPAMLCLYRKLLRSQGAVHLKTDDEELMRYCSETARRLGAQVDEAVWNLHGTDFRLLAGGAREEFSTSVTTTFESRHLERGKTIKYLRFRFSPQSDTGDPGAFCDQREVDEREW